MDHTYHNFLCSSKVSVDLLRKVDLNLVQITHPKQTMVNHTLENVTTCIENI